MVYVTLHERRAVAGLIRLLNRCLAGDSNTSEISTATVRHPPDINI